MDMKNELLGEFVLEAQAHIAEVEAGLLQMENDEGDAETVHKIFRAVHSIKGTAGFFELQKIVELSHAMESLFGALREEKISATRDMIDNLLTATDMLKELVGHLEENETYDIAAQVAGVKVFLPQEKIAAPKASAWDLWEQLTTETEEKNELTGSHQEGDAKLSTWELWDQLTTDEKPLQKSTAAVLKTAYLQEESWGTAGTGGKRETITASGDKKRDTIGSSVRVSVELLNDLLNMVGELVLRRNQLLRISQNASKEIPHLQAVAQSIDNLTTGLQEKVMKTRMQPIANVFNKFPRIVRELSRKMQKEVELVMEGLTVELDRSIIESLLDPITHLIRNALDHGIEAPEIRLAQNKPAAGVVKLHAYHESGRVIIDICDDGAGIDVEKVKTKAVAKGWMSEKEAANMRELDVLNFILRPGFSTADSITDISGRGVGMDVVKTNIEKLGGKVEIHTEAGAGTIFRLMLPLTLAIISSFIVEASGFVFAIPQVGVKELVLIQPGEQQGKKIEFIHSAPVLRLRNQLLPIFRLGDLIETSTLVSGGQDNYEYFANGENTFRILVIKSGSLRYGLAVDAVYDTEEILVKPVPAVLNAGGCYSGVTVLGDGRIAMIVDPESLRSLAKLCAIEESNAPRNGDEAVKKQNTEEQYLLLFKCSGGEMLGLDLAMVSRIEEVQLPEIQKIGAKHYMAFRGQTIRVIHPEHYLPIGRQANDRAKVYVIMPKLVKHPVGIIAEEIHDAVLTTIQLDTSGVCGKGIIGSTLVGGNIVTLLNIYELFEIAVPELYGRVNAAKGRSVKKLLSAVEQESGKRVVLLVEDTPFFLKLTKNYLESGGYQVLTAENGREALDILLQRHVDVVVSDIEMPIMNGIELIRSIRANDTLRQLPAIALTSLTSETDKERGLRAGYDIYQFKLDRGRLLDSVAQMLSKAQ